MAVNRRYVTRQTYILYFTLSHFRSLPLSASFPPLAQTHIHAHKRAFASLYMHLVSCTQVHTRRCSHEQPHPYTHIRIHKHVQTDAERYAYVLNIYEAINNLIIAEIYFELHIQPGCLLLICVECL